jgi:hypothetical protein
LREDQRSTKFTLTATPFVSPQWLIKLYPGQQIDPHQKKRHMPRCRSSRIREPQLYGVDSLRQSYRFEHRRTLRRTVAITSSHLHHQSFLSHSCAAFRSPDHLQIPTKDTKLYLFAYSKSCPSWICSGPRRRLHGMRPSIRQPTREHISDTDPQNLDRRYRCSLSASAHGAAQRVLRCVDHLPCLHMACLA